MSGLLYSDLQIKGKMMTSEMLNLIRKMERAQAAVIVGGSPLTRFRLDEADSATYVRLAKHAPHVLDAAIRKPIPHFRTVPVELDATTVSHGVFGMMVARRIALTDDGMVVG